MSNKKQTATTKAEEKKTVDLAGELKTKDVAALAKTTPRQLRKWLREPDRFADHKYTRYAFAPNSPIVKAAIARFAKAA